MAGIIEKIEAAGITNVEKLAGMTPEQLMEIPGIGEKMVDKIYQAVNRFYEGGEAAAAAVEPGENTDALAEDAAPAEEATAPTEAAVEGTEGTAEAAVEGTEGTAEAAVEAGPAAPATQDEAATTSESADPEGAKSTETESDPNHPEESKS